jgi:hypothetical protein
MGPVIQFNGTYAPSCTPCSVTGSFTVSQPLGANVSLQLRPILLSYSFTAGPVTINSDNSSNPNVGSVRTDSQGNIVSWQIILADSTYDIIRTYSDESDLVEYVVGVAEIVNSPGTWSESSASSCNLSTAVSPFADRPLSADLYNTTINASFTPTRNGTPISLAAAAADCGFVEFDWQQTVTLAPGPIPLPVWTTNGTPPVAPFSDPPPGGYVDLQIPPFLGAYPFYYNPLFVVPTECIVEESNGVCDKFATTSDGNTLNFFDRPLDYCLPGGSYVNEAICSFSEAPSGSKLGFRTALVGVLAGNTLGRELYHWTWETTFNGVSGGVNGISGGVATNAISPGATGTGGVTITSINGVPQTPPSATCAANPTTLWPPNGKSVLVTVSGSITAGTSALAATTYAVLDGYGQVQPSGNVVLGAGGSYSFGVPLIATRNGDDLDGRTYTISVKSSDAIGNVGACSAAVIVPHDQGQ